MFTTPTEWAGTFVLSKGLDSKSSTTDHVMPGPGTGGYYVQAFSRREAHVFYNKLHVDMY